MKRPITHEPLQIADVNKLRLTVRHSDHELKQVWRDETHAVYKHFGSHGQFIGWEAIKIKKQKANTVFGKDCPNREVYPSAGDFGRYALSVGAGYDLGIRYREGQDIVKPDLKTLFPKASKSFLDANPALSLAIARYDLEDKLRANVAPPQPRRGTMNKTETEFSFILEAQKRRGDILRYEFEGITLRFAGVRYTPDFVVFPSALAVSGQIKFCEVKGAFVKGHFERAIERFRHAKTYWPQFIFELHQRTKDGWRQVL